MARKHQKNTLVKLGIVQNNKEAKELINAFIKILPYAILLYDFRFIKQINMIKFT